VPLKADIAASVEIESKVESNVEATFTTTTGAATTTATTSSNVEKTTDSVETTVTVEQKEAQDVSAFSEPAPTIDYKSANEETKNDVPEAKELKKEAEVQESTQAIYGEDLLNDLFAFIKPAEELNSTSTGYFCKIALQLVNPREGKVTLKKLFCEYRLLIIVFFN